MVATFCQVLPLLVWLGFFLIIAFFVVMYHWAKKRKGIALAFGIFVQIFLPDPKVEHTIACISKEQKSCEQQGHKDKL